MLEYRKEAIRKVCDWTGDGGCILSVYKKGEKGKCQSLASMNSNRDYREISTPLGCLCGVFKILLYIQVLWHLSGSHMLPECLNRLVGRANGCGVQWFIPLGEVPCGFLPAAQGLWLTSSLEEELKMSDSCWLACQGSGNLAGQFTCSQSSTLTYFHNIYSLKIWLPLQPLFPQIKEE